MFYSYDVSTNRAMKKRVLFSVKSHLNKIKNGHIVSFKSMISIWAEWKLSKRVLV